MNFLSNKFIRWLASLFLFLILWITVPFLNVLWMVFSLLHIPVLIWGIVDIRNCFFCHAYCHNDSHKSAVALTLDDGPDPNITPYLLHLLKKFGYRATFFVIAKKAQKYPELLRQIYEQGHIVACHDLHHGITSNFRLTKSMVSEIGESQKIIEEIIGQKPLLYRPPVGLTNPHLPGALKKLNLSCIGWSGSVGDGGNRFTRRFEYIPQLARPGSVILLHDTLPDEKNRDQLLKMIEKLFQIIQEKELKVMGVDEFFGLRAYE